MAYSPMMMHFLDTKRQYEDCILLYRLGDFYEMFFEDAEKASEILDLVLTARDCGDNKRAPMCGVPFHAVDGYIAKLIAAGCKVAICEQLSEPNGRGMVERDVVRVVTPGTVMESSVLEEKRNNFIASVTVDTENAVGVAIADLSTGYIAVSEFSGVSQIQQLNEFLVSFSPSEIVANASGAALVNGLECVKSGSITRAAVFDSSNFDCKKANTLATTHFAVNTLDGFGLNGKKYAVGALGGLLSYLKETQKRDLPHLKSVSYLSNNHYMSLDIKTRKNLELVANAKDGKRRGSLLWLIDKTATGMGARMLSDWVERPLQSAALINRRLEGVAELYSSFIFRDAIGEILHKLKDIERLAGKIAYNSAMPKDLFVLKQSLKLMPDIKALLATKHCKVLTDINGKVDDFVELTYFLDTAICDETAETKLPATLNNGGYIKRGFDSELDRLIDLSENGGKAISELEQFERERTGIKTLKLGYNKVFGYYFEVSNSFKDSLPADFIRKQTLVNGERFVSERLKVLEEELLTAQVSRQKLERDLYDKVRTKLLAHIAQLQSASRAIAGLDCLYSLAVVAVSNGYVRPKICTNSSELKIIGGRHPVVESYLKSGTFITNDTLLDTDENRTLVITGPNMAGKSTYMRQVALIVLLAHIGSFVPAQSADVPIVDKIFTRVGASDDLTFNQSTFMVEMVEVANILNNATKNSLIILDEVGRGTSTFDGLSIAWAIVEYVSHNIAAKTLFATHFHELTDLEGVIDGVKNYKIVVKEQGDGIIFLYKITRGGADKSFGIEVAALAGVPSAVCQRAKEIVKLLENSDITFKLDSVETAKSRKDASKQLADIAAILRDLDINRCSPIEAFEILADLTKRVKDK